MKRKGIALTTNPLAVRTAQDEVISGEPGHVETVQPKAWLERVLERENLSMSILRETFKIPHAAE